MNAKTSILVKVLIIDFDVHHGNGTQDIFYDDASVYYFSSHGQNSYPGTGSEDETGEEEGKGFTSNHILASRSGDEDMINLYKEKLPPLVEKFNPDIILVSAGYDIHKSDPQGGLSITTQGIGMIFLLISIWRNSRIVLIITLLTKIVA